MGSRKGASFHGYYDHYCFWPLYVTCRDQLLAAYLRPSNIDGAKHAWAILALLVKRLRRAWPNVRIVLRADSGFCRWRMLAWCDRHNVFYIVGLAKNKRINELAAPQIENARKRCEATRSELCQREPNLPMAYFAGRARVSESYATRILRLAYFAPDIVEAIVAGNQPRSLILKKLLREIPLSWAEQRERFGIRQT